MRKRSWTKKDLESAVATSGSIRQVISKLHLVEAGGNYTQIKKYIETYKLDMTHFWGMRWNRGMKGRYLPTLPLRDILVKGSDYQSYKLKIRLFREGIKNPICEECSWAKQSLDGRIPVELDHINGDRKDNRLDNLRILCPNCHSLKLTHRGKNIHKCPGGETGQTRRT